MFRHFAVWIMLVLCLVAKSPLQADSSGQLPEIPEIRRAAILPVYWQGEAPVHRRWPEVKARVDAQFSPLVLASKRFLFANDVLTQDYWSSAEGRRKLAEEFEIDAFINLTVSVQGDSSLFTVRLLNASLQNYLSESQTLALSQLLIMPLGELDLWLKSLLFRLLNRFPVDVFVRSLQGKYLTLSGGTEQNVFEGDLIQVVETKIQTVHPADGSWLQYKQKSLGTARVVESKRQSSIAVITGLTFPDAIKVGDGAKIPSIASRRHFQKEEAKPELYAPVEEGSPIVQALPIDARRKETAELALPETQMPAPKPSRPQPNPDVAYESRQAEAPVPLTEPEGLGEETKSDPSAELNLREFLPQSFQNLRLQAAYESWQISGAAKAKNTFPLWLVNRLDLAAEQSFGPGLFGMPQAHLQFGSTAKGSYFGFGLAYDLGLRYPIKTLLFPSLESITLSMLGRFESLAVDGESFGGWDSLNFSPGVRLKGVYHVTSMAQSFDYDWQSRLRAMESGKAGVAGSNRDIQGAFLLSTELSVLERGKAESWEWGGMISWESGSYDLSKGSLNLNRYRVGLAGRLRL